MSSSLMWSGLISLLFIVITLFLFFLMIMLFRKAHKLRKDGKATGLYVLLANLIIPILVLPALYASLYLMDFIDDFEKEFFEAKPPAIMLAPGGPESGDSQ